METVERKRTKPASERRREILQAATSLFQDKGYAETTIGEIAGAAGVAAGTVYLYFPSKDHILLALHDQFHEGLASLIGEVAADAFERRAAGAEIDLNGTIDMIVESIANYSVSNREIAQVCMRHMPASGDIADLGAPDRHFIAFLGGLFKVAADQGIIHTSDPEMLAHLISAAIGYPIGTSLAFGDPPDMERLVAAMKELLYKALSPGPESRG